MPIVTNGLLAYYNSKQGQTVNSWTNIAPSTLGKFNLSATGSQYITMSPDGAILKPDPNKVTAVNYLLDSPAFNTTFNQITIELYVHFQTFGSYEEILGFNTFLMFNYNKSGIGLGVGIGEEQYKLAYPLSTSKGTYLTITIDKNTTPDTHKFYQDGVFIGQLISDTSMNFNTGDFIIGTFDKNFTPNAIIDNIRVYNRVLSDLEVAQNHSNLREIGLTTNTGTPKTATFKTKQFMYKTISLPFKINHSLYKASTIHAKTKQLISRAAVTKLITTQSIYKSNAQSHKTSQTIYKSIISKLTTKQLISKISTYKTGINLLIHKPQQIDSVVTVYSFKKNEFCIPTNIQIFKHGDIDYFTKQKIYNRLFITDRLRQNVFNGTLFNLPVRQIIYCKVSNKFSLINQIYIQQQISIRNKIESYKTNKKKFSIITVIHKENSLALPVDINIFSSLVVKILTNQIIYDFENNYTKIINFEFLIKREVNLTVSMTTCIDINTIIKSTVDFVIII